MKGSDLARRIYPWEEEEEEEGRHNNTSEGERRERKKARPDSQNPLIRIY